MIRSHRLKDLPVLKTETDVSQRIITDPHWRDMIRESQEDSEIAARIEAGDTSKYVIYEEILYYLSRRD